MTTARKIGRYMVSTVQDHQSPDRDPSAVYPSVPKEAWDPYRSFALDPDGKYRSQWRGHLIRLGTGSGPVVLVDTGMGPGPHSHTGRNGELLASMAAAGVRPDQVTDVVITHTHGDHIGWNVTWEDGKPGATFPKATYHIAAADWEHYSKASPANDAFEKQVRPLKDLGRLDLVKGDAEVAPGIRTLPTNGHTPGHQCVLVQSDGDTGVLTGDLFHNMAQVTEQHWCPTFDWNTELSTASRRWLLWRARAEGWVVFSGHLPNGRSIGRVVERGGKSAWQPV
jgi:glyoxylase-like metal-dependent hydrolase (beta-lactamase superfamily II)